MFNNALLGRRNYFEMLNTNLEILLEDGFESISSEYQADVVSLQTAIAEIEKADVDISNNSAVQDFVIKNNLLTSDYI